ncbi:MAG TPA: hypothetical protein VE890_10210 [Thermoguttaceae bacterium]|nr:hypothetical protein [Thermoguttaceae bacterium]
MKRLVLGALTGAVLVMAAFGAMDHGSEGFAQQFASQQRMVQQRLVADGQRVVLGDQLIAVPGAIDEKGQLLTVIDPKQRVMSVYHIDSATGKIGLRSVRNIHWDLQMMEFDNEGLPPREIRALLEQR